MTKAMIWTCDRCGGRVEVEYATHIVDEWPVAVRDGLGPLEPDGWRQFETATEVLDVCPGCVTDSEWAGFLLAEIEREDDIPL